MRKIAIVVVMSVIALASFGVELMSSHNDYGSLVRLDCASLYRDEYPFYVKRPSHSSATHAEGIGEAVRHYAW